MKSGAKILYVNANNEEVGGADFALVKMAVEAKRAGYEPLLLLRKSTLVLDLYKEFDIPVIVKPILRLRATSSRVTKMTYPFQMIGTVLTIYRILKSERIDLLHSNDFIDGLGNLAAMLAGIPSCQHIRVIGHKPRWLVAFLKLLSLRCSDRIICISEAVQREMFEHSTERTVVLYDWLDMDTTGLETGTSSLYDELNLVPDTKIVGCVGRLEWWKGQHVFLQAVELVAKRIGNIHFVVVGGTTTNKENYLDELNRIRSALEFRDRVSFLGFRMDISNIMKQLSVMVHASVRPEPMGSVIAEAMYCGAVVVAASAGGVLEQIKDGETGYLYTPGDAADMAAKILIALETPQREEIVLRARQEITTKFGKRPNVEQLFRLYDSLVTVHVHN